jgi:hypothetical protein
MFVHVFSYRMWIEGDRFSRCFLIWWVQKHIHLIVWFFCCLPWNENVRKPACNSVKKFLLSIFHKTLLSITPGCHFLHSCTDVVTIIRLGQVREFFVNLRKPFGNCSDYGINIRSVTSHKDLKVRDGATNVWRASDVLFHCLPKTLIFSRKCMRFSRCFHVKVGDRELDHQMVISFYLPGGWRA